MPRLWIFCWLMVRVLKCITKFFSTVPAQFHPHEELCASDVRSTSMWRGWELGVFSFFSSARTSIFIFNFLCHLPYGCLQHLLSPLSRLSADAILADVNRWNSSVYFVIVRYCVLLLRYIHCLSRHLRSSWRSTHSFAAPRFCVLQRFRPIRRHCFSYRAENGCERFSADSHVSFWRLPLYHRVS